MKTRQIVSAAAAVLVLAAPGGAAGKEIVRDFNKSYDVQQGWSLRLRHGDGDVMIIPWDKDEVEISVRYVAEHKSLGDDSKSDFDVEFREKNGVIEVVGKEKKSGFMGFQVYIVKEYTYKISAPAYLDLDLNGEDGDVEVEKWKGNIEIDLDDGSIGLYGCSPRSATIRMDDGELTLEGHSGLLDVNCADGRVDIVRGRFEQCRILLEDGEIRVRDSEGDFNIEVDDADTELYRIRTRVMELKSEDGDFDIELLETDGLDLDIKTEDGDVDLGLQSGISATFSIDVDDGSIRTDLPSVRNGQEGGHWMSGTIGDGKGRIRIRTLDGSVMLREIR